LRLPFILLKTNAQLFNCNQFQNILKLVPFLQICPFWSLDEFSSAKMNFESTSRLGVFKWSVFIIFKVQENTLKFSICHCSHVYPHVWKNGLKWDKRTYFLFLYTTQISMGACIKRFNIWSLLTRLFEFSVKFVTKSTLKLPFGGPIIDEFLLGRVDLLHRKQQSWKNVFDTSCTFNQYTWSVTGMVVRKALKKCHLLFEWPLSYRTSKIMFKN